MSGDTDKTRRAAWSSIGYATRHKHLSWGMPVPLRSAPRVTVHFNVAHESPAAAQLDDLQKTEAQRREENARSSKPVKMRYPMASLVRENFNSEGLRALRDERFAEFESQRARQNEQSNDNQIRPVQVKQGRVP